VHCAAGISRSSSVVAAFLLSKKMFPGLNECLQFLKTKRPKIDPHPGFRQAILEYQKSEFTVVSRPELQMPPTTRLVKGQNL